MKMMLSSIMPALCLLTLTLSVPVDESDKNTATKPTALQVRAVANSARLGVVDNPLFGDDFIEDSKKKASERRLLHIRGKDEKQSVLKSQSFNDFSIADGKSGNAEQEANELFQAINRGKLTDVSQSDYELIKKTNTVCNEAEVQGFNGAIKSAEKNEAKALQRGKIKNKVLKLTATKLALEIEQANGLDVKDKMADALKKLKKNIETDRGVSGEPSKGVKFDKFN